MQQDFCRVLAGLLVVERFVCWQVQAVCWHIVAWFTQPCDVKLYVSLFWGGVRLEEEYLAFGFHSPCDCEASMSGEGARALVILFSGAVVLNVNRLQDPCSSTTDDDALPS